MIFGMMALVIDVGQLFVVKSELQSAADAASLAAAEHIDNPSQAIAAAQQWAQENHPGGGGLIVLPSDVEFGKWDATTGTWVPRRPMPFE